MKMEVWVQTETGWEPRLVDVIEESDAKQEAQPREAGVEREIVP